MSTVVGETLTGQTLTGFGIFLEIFYKSIFIYRSFLISTWQSSKLDSGRKAHFWSKLRRFFDYCSGRPEFNLEVVPSWDQDNSVAKNKGRQRASKSRKIFHIGGPNIQCICTKQGSKDRGFGKNFSKGGQGPTNGGIGPNFKMGVQGSTDRRFGPNFKKGMQGSRDGRIDVYF